MAFLVLGRWVWPAILVAAFAVNLPLGPAPLGAAVIAAGNTLAPLTASELLRRVGFHLELDRLRDAAAIIFLGALAGMTISATVGTTVLIFSGSVAGNRFAETWAVWWTGDAMGVLMVAPFLLSLLTLQSPRPLTIQTGLELLGVLVATAVVTYALFLNDLRLEYLVLPLIMLAAWRFRLRGAAPAALIASGVAIVCAVNGLGPFAEETLFEKMVTLQVFNVSLALASFVLSSFVETRERKEEVVRLYASAQAASEAKTRFLNLAAHELRTPITVLTGYISLLSDGSLGAVPTAWKSALETLSAKTKELNRLVADLLEASRIEGNAVAGVRAELNLAKAIEDAAERARPRADLMCAEISWRPVGEPITVEVDGIQVGRILDNLINNGLTYTNRTARIAISMTEKGHHAVVRVEDNGVGIAPEERERVFDQFHRTNDPAFANVPGTGLGLYISRQLAVANGGRLEIERSAPGEGTVFALTLPIAKPNGKTGPDSGPNGATEPQRQIAPSDAIGAAQR